MKKMHHPRGLASVLLFAAQCSRAAAARPPASKLLNVSYDPTRELYQDVNAAFAKHWQAKTGQTVTVNQSHGGSGKQARAVIDGLEADVVTLAMSYDIDAIQSKSGRIAARLAGSGCPTPARRYTSTVVFVVRKGNPLRHPRLERPDEARRHRVTANPKTSGGARWNYLAAWGYALRANGGDEAKAKEFMRTLYHNVPVLDSGARGSTMTFAQRGIGQVLIAWENEALPAGQASWAATSSRSSRRPPASCAEPPVAVVDQNVDKHGTRAVAEAYLAFLYTRRGPGDRRQAPLPPARPGGRCSATPPSSPSCTLFTVDEIAGGWQKAQRDALRRRRHLRPDLPAGDMSAGVPAEVAVSTAPRRARRRANRGPLPGFGLSLGVTLTLPVPDRAHPARGAGVQVGGAVARTSSGRRCRRPRALAAYRISFGGALASGLVNGVFGLVLAWVLTRYRLPGKALLDAMVDLPFALPTAVAGIALTALFTENGWLGRFLEPHGIKVAFAPAGVVIAMIFVGLPFVVRTVQPVLMDIDPSMEEVGGDAGRLAPADAARG